MESEALGFAKTPVYRAREEEKIMQYNQDVEMGILIAGAIIVVLFVLVCVLARFVTDFSRELRILNIEIERTEGEEREHYIRQRRRLWLSLLPFIHY